MKYGIAIFPSKAIQDEANGLRKRYDSAFAEIDPHITLKSRFNLDETKRDEIIEELDKIASDTKPFEITINKVSTFAPVTNTVYFKVDPIPQLQELHEKMHQGVFQQDQEYSFVPHITIAQELGDEEYHDVFDTLQMKKIEMKDMVDQFQLCNLPEDGIWQIYKTFKLGNQ